MRSVTTEVFLPKLSSLWIFMSVRTRLMAAQPHNTTPIKHAFEEFYRVLDIYNFLSCTKNDSNKTNWS